MTVGIDDIGIQARVGLATGGLVQLDEQLEAVDNDGQAVEGDGGGSGSRCDGDGGARQHEGEEQ